MKGVLISGTLCLLRPHRAMAEIIEADTGRCLETDELFGDDDGELLLEPMTLGRDMSVPTPHIGAMKELFSPARKRSSAGAQMDFLK